jgi:hypothetical protein
MTDREIPIPGGGGTLHIPEGLDFGKPLGGTCAPISAWQGEAFRMLAGLPDIDTSRARFKRTRGVFDDWLSVHGGERLDDDVDLDAGLVSILEEWDRLAPMSDHLLDMGPLTFPREPITFLRPPDISSPEWKREQRRTARRRKIRRTIEGLPVIAGALRTRAGYRKLRARIIDARAVASGAKTALTDEEIEDLADD